MSQIKSWKVRFKGRIERIVIFYVSLIVAFGIYARFQGDELNTAGWIGILAFTSFIWIPVLIVTMRKLLKSKIPKEVIINHENQTCELVFSKRNKEVIPFDILGYSFSNKFKDHNSVTFYKTFVGSRGQLVFNKVTEIIGMDMTLSWKKQHVLEMGYELAELPIAAKKADNEDLSLWDRIISN